MTAVPTGAVVSASALVTAAAVALAAARGPGRRVALRLRTLAVLGTPPRGSAPCSSPRASVPGASPRASVPGSAEEAPRCAGVAVRYVPAPVRAVRLRALRQAHAAALPDTADLLTVSLHAGLNVPLALRRVAAHAPEPLRSELDRVNGEVALGTPLGEALASLAARTGVPEVGSLVSILRGADRLGSRVADAIEQWADDLWTRRRYEAEAAARQAPVKILLPLVFLLLPGFLLTTVVPLLLSTVRTLGW